MRWVYGHAEFAVYIRGKRAYFKVPCASADDKFRQDADTQIVFYHGEDGKIVVHRIFNIRVDVVLF